MLNTSILLLVLLFVIFPALMCNLVNSMQFELKPHQHKCIYEEIKENSKNVGKYSVVNHPVADSRKITVWVRSPLGKSFHFGDQVDSGNFAFTAAEAGDHTACFSISDHTSTLPMTIDFEWKTVVILNDWDKIATKGPIQEMEFEVQKLQDIATLIQDEMHYLQEREEEMQDLNRATDNKMFILSFLSILICLSVAGLQLWHLKTFFKKKKII